jgi:hypothetical protein
VMKTWNMDMGGAVLPTDEARRWLHKVIADRYLVGDYLEHLKRIDKIGLRPPLMWAAYLKHRDGIMADPELWGSLNDGLRAWMIVPSDNEIDELVSMIIENALVHYREAMQDNDDDGDFSLLVRGRVLTKGEAERAIIDLILTGNRQDLLDGLAELNDSFKTMLAAVPLESEDATRQLVCTVVKGVVAAEYCERPMGDHE